MIGMVGVELLVELVDGGTVVDVVVVEVVVVLVVVDSGGFDVEVVGGWVVDVVDVDVVVVGDAVLAIEQEPGLRPRVPGHANFLEAAT